MGSFWRSFALRNIERSAGWAIASGSALLILGTVESLMNGNLAATLELAKTLPINTLQVGSMINVTETIFGRDLLPSFIKKNPGECMVDDTDRSLGRDPTQGREHVKSRIQSIGAIHEAKLVRLKEAVGPEMFAEAKAALASPEELTTMATQQELYDANQIEALRQQLRQRREAVYGKLAIAEREPTLPEQ